MKLEHLKNYIKASTDCGGGLSLGTINANTENCIGIYPARQDGTQRVCLGGDSCTQTQTSKATILIHWGKSNTIAEQKARELYALFYAKSNFVMDGLEVFCTDAGAAPIFVGRDGASIYEFVINLTITHKKE